MSNTENESKCGCIHCYYIYGEMYEYTDANPQLPILGGRFVPQSNPHLFYHGGGTMPDTNTDYYVVNYYTEQNNDHSTDEMEELQ